MSQIIQAVYENGVLRPLASLPLRQKQIVQLQILHDPSSSAIESAIQSLVDEGLLTLPQGYPEADPATESERNRLSKILGESLITPISEIIIEERRGKIGRIADRKSK